MLRNGLAKESATTHENDASLEESDTAASVYTKLVQKGSNKCEFKPAGSVLQQIRYSVELQICSRYIPTTNVTALASRCLSVRRLCSSSWQSQLGKPIWQEPVQVRHGFLPAASPNTEQEGTGGTTCKCFHKRRFFFSRLSSGARVLGAFPLIMHHSLSSLRPPPRFSVVFIPHHRLHRPLGTPASLTHTRQRYM